MTFDHIHAFIRVVALSVAGVTGVFAQSAPPQPSTDPTADLVKQGRALNAAGKQDDALALYRRALELKPDSYDAHLGMGGALDLKGAYAEARTHLAKAIELAPPDAKGPALAAMAVSHAFEAHAGEAATFYQQVFDAQMTASAFGGAAGTANALGRTYLESGDLANALKWYQTGYEAARRQPDQPAAELDLWEMRWHHAQGRIAVRRGNEAEARRHVAAFKALMDKRANKDDSADYQYLLGYVAFYAGDFDTAIAEFLQGNLKDPFILGLVAQAYEKKGDALKAREYYRRVLEQNGHSLNNAFSRPLAVRKTR